MSNIMMNTIAGDKQLNRSEVSNLALAQTMGARHNPISFIDRIEYITASLEKFGFRIVAESFVVTKNGQQIFGLLQLESVVDGYSTILAFNGSLNQTLSFHIAFGGGTWICSNLEIYGEFQVKTKQTTFIRERLPLAIDNVISLLPEKMIERQETITTYKSTQLTGRQGDAAITEMVRREIILPSNVGTVINEWDKPTYEEHTQWNVGNGRSIYQLQQAVTQAQKPANGRSVIGAAMERTPAMDVYLKYIVSRLNG